MQASTVGGGQIGYNFQAGAWLFGLETDIQWSSADKTTSVSTAVVNFAPQTFAYTRTLDWLGTFRGRLGYLVTPQFLLYGTGGLAYGHTKFQNNYICPTCGALANVFGETSDTRSGWTAGGGVEWMFLPQWSLKVEYLYVDLGEIGPIETSQTGFGTLISTVNDRMNIVRGGINYHF